MKDLYEILATREKTGPTMREMHEMLRDRETVGYPAWKSLYEGDWLDDTEPVARDRWSPDPVVVVHQLELFGSAATDPDDLDATRGKLAVAVEKTAEAQGLTITSVTWNSDRLVDPMGVMIRAVASCQPRMDGEWPAIREALKQDELDRKEAEAWADGPVDPVTGETVEIRSADGELIRSTFVEDKLDALAASSAIWTSSTPGETLAGSRSLTSVTLRRLAADGSPLPDTLPTTVTGRVRFGIR